MQHLYKLSKQAGSKNFSAKSKVNVLAICSHILITLAYTVSQFIIIFWKNETQYKRMDSAFYFFGALADVFLSVMLWFILDTE